MRSGDLGEAISAEAERDFRSALWSWQEKFKPTDEQVHELFMRVLDEIKFRTW